MFGVNNIRVRRRFDGQSITGVANFLAPMGAVVLHGDVTIPSLVLATSRKGFCLVRDVGAPATLSALLIQDQVFPVASSVLYPDTQGNAVTASKVLEAEIEGPGLVVYSGTTGFIAAGTALNTALSTLNGALRVAQGGDETTAYLRQQLTPLDPNNPARILVEYTVE